MRKLLTLFALLLTTSAYAKDAPAELNRDSYSTWLAQVGSVSSPYLERIFDWAQEQRSARLPDPVLADPDKLFVTVERPLADAIEAEANGDVEAGVTYGLETYGVIDAPVATVLETILFRWGKPIGSKAGGITYPVDTVFSYREEKAQPMWGPNAYRVETVMKGGGVAKDQSDISSLIVRGDARRGYMIIGNFYGALGKTPTTSSMSIMLLTPTADGKTDYRVSGRYTGQSYKMFGLDFGRKNYGFNVSRIRNGQKDFYLMVDELKRTGKITERKPKGGEFQSSQAPSDK